MRILHLIDPASPGGGACTLRLLAEPLTRLPDSVQDVVVIGTAAHVELARRCGVEPLGAINAPARLTCLAVRPLRELIAIRELTVGHYDLVHAWTAPAAALAAVAAPRRA